MKRIVKIVAPLVLLLSAATAAVAMAAPVQPSDPFPDVYDKVDPKIVACMAERQAMEKAEDGLRTATKLYNIDAAGQGTGTIRGKELRQSEQKLHEAELKLSDAKHMLALCLNNQTKDPNKACFELANKLSRLKAELEIREEMLKIAQTDYNLAVPAHDRKALSDRDFAILDGALQDAKTDVRHTKEKIDAVRADIAAAGNKCPGYEFEPTGDEDAEQHPTVTASPTVTSEPPVASGTPTATVSPVPVP